MGRMYIAQFNGVAVTALQDLFEITNDSKCALRIHEWSLHQTSDVGDSAEELLRLETVRGVGATAGSGGSTVTPAKVDNGDAAALSTVKANNTTRMTAGSGSVTTLEQRGWNVRVPYERIYTPETRPTIAPSNKWTLALPVGPADSLTVSGMVLYEEIGG